MTDVLRRVRLLHSLAPASMLLIMVLTTVAGCRPDEVSDSTVASTPKTPEGMTMASTVDESEGEKAEMPAPSRDIPEALRDAPEVVAALEMALKDAGVDQEDIALLDVSEVTWPDSGLGCGEPGVSYLQVLTPGYRVMAWVDGARAIYHTSRGAEQVIVVPCDNARSKGMSIETLAGQMLGRITEDLVSRVDEDVQITPLGLTLVPAQELSCDDGPIEQSTTDPDTVSAVTLMQLAITEFRIQAGSAIHVYRAYKDNFLYCGSQGFDAEGNPTD